MPDMKHIVIVGGHGKVALLATRTLSTIGYTVGSVIRQSDQQQAIEDAGGSPILLDVETASETALSTAFSDATAIVFAAGAGGGDPDRTRAVDYGGATRAMAAAQSAGVGRFVIVSYMRAATDVDKLDPDNNFYPYAKAKHDADEVLRQSTLDYTILGPGKLTSEAATGEIQLADAEGEVEGDWPDDNKVTSRDNVAEVIAYVIDADAALRQTVNFYDGNTPIAEALS